jgi:hypothetical protein
MNDFSLWSVNWKDGMLVSQKHLKEQERYFEELLRWTLFHLPHEYGLVKNPLHMGDPLDVSFTMEGDVFRVSLRTCTAVTPAGHLIYVTDANQGDEPIRAHKQVTLKGSEKLGVYLAVKPNSKKEVGDPDPEEDPPRFPYLTSRYELVLGEAPNLAEGTFLQVGELEVMEGRVEPSRDFIPPCVTIASFSRLQNQIARFYNTLESIQGYALAALQGFARGSPAETLGGQGQVKSLLSQFDWLVQNIAGSLDIYLSPLSNRSPREVVGFFKGFFRGYQVFFKLDPGLKEFIINEYFAKKLTPSQGDMFFELFESFEKSSYNHSDLRGHLRQINQILQIMEGILKFYAGGIPVSEETIVYEGIEYNLIGYQKQSYRQERDVHYLVLDGFGSKSLQNLIVRVKRGVIRREDYPRITAYLGANEDDTLATAEPSVLDTEKYPEWILIKPRMDVSSLGLNRLNIIFAGAIDNRRLSSASPDEVQVFKHGVLSDFA